MIVDIEEGGMAKGLMVVMVVVIVVVDKMFQMKSLIMHRSRKRQMYSRRC